MPASAAARGPAASPGRGPMAPGWAMLVMLVLVLSTLQVCGAVPAPELGQQRGVQWVWGAARQAQADPPLLSRRKRAEGGQQPSTPTATPGHGHAATTMPSSNETDSPEPDPLLGSVPAPAPSTNASLHRALVVPTTADPLDETDSPEPDLLLSSAPPPAPGTNTNLHRALAVPTKADPLDETDSPEPDLLLSSAPPPAPRTNASLHWALAVPTTADPLDETDSPEPDLLLSSASPAEPGTQAAPQMSVTTIPSQLTSPGEEGTVAGGMNSSSSMGQRSVTPPALSPTTTGYKKVKKAGPPPTPTRSAPWDTKPEGTMVPVPWDPSRVMGKCLLAILLLALVAATFMVCTGVLGALLWRRARTAHRRLSHTEMVCISSLLPDGEVTTNGSKPGPARRSKLLLDGGSEADGDNLTLSSFLPEHS
ncbi:P-selectin glycoprotein ligand 1 [Harpia harpyja]|uniref:P-selectin glycoprotein ligand 1 n=1 Tax=Harpia harpyja TaxID=202280 RepID=UPI0022B1C403|nr:P-selectin glycoprotein ligand 1 [Harpia harpyja]